MYFSYKFRIYPNRTQITVLENQFQLCRWLYNSALEHRIIAYKNMGKNIYYKNQAAELPEIKEQFPQFNDVYSQVLQDVLKRLDKTFNQFFKRIKKGDKIGFPRFRGKERFNSIKYPQTGFKIIGSKIKISKIGCLKIKLHREIKGDIKTCSIIKRGNQWYVNITVKQLPKNIHKSVSTPIGIDLGLENFAVLSNGDIINNPRYLKQSEEKLNNLQAKYSNYRGLNTKKRLSTLHRKISNQRTDFLHKQSRLLVDKYGLIVYEDLKINKMTRGIFSKSIHDAGWGKFIYMLKYKAESAGVYTIGVNPKNTSQICSSCGAFVKKEIYERQHDCPVCGISINRDLNASLNILRSGIDLLNEKNIINESAFNTDIHSPIQIL